MQKDRLVPIAFCDKDGWPAMGTFDYINMRINGYDFHMSLMAGKEAWTDKRVKDVFDTWRSILPYCQPGANGRTWQEAAHQPAEEAGGHGGLRTPAPRRRSSPRPSRPTSTSSRSRRSTRSTARTRSRRPSTASCSRRRPRTSRTQELESAKDLLKCLATGKAEDIYLASDPNNIAVSDEADISKYTPLQKKAVELVSGAKQISQFLDRDTRPDFASTVMIPAIQTFINKPKDMDGLVKSIERQKKTIFASED